MKTNTKANLGLAILLGAASGSASAVETCTKNLDAAQKEQFVELLKKLKVDFKGWETAGPHSQPSRCYTV